MEVKETKKAVIVSTADDPAFYQRTIKMILAKNAFESCTVYCSVPCCTSDYPGISPTEEKLNYSKLKRDIETWMSSKNLSQVCLLFIYIIISIIANTIIITITIICWKQFIRLSLLITNFK